MLILGILKQWWRKLFGGDLMAKNYDIHTWKIWQSATITVTSDADTEVLRMMAQSSARYKR